MPPLGVSGRAFTFRRWLSSTPRRTFVLYPALVIACELLIRGGTLAFEPFGLILLAWGYLQYRWSGNYRTRHGGGGPGLDNPPQRLVTTGIYQYTRNPMYTGHLLFMAGLAITFHSWPALALLVFHMWWFNQRVIDDEHHIRMMFGTDYEPYARNVKRWGLV
jgi:protein-S-isoprenylcysteine O-methyltransferase Ste14